VEVVVLPLPGRRAVRIRPVLILMLVLAAVLLPQLAAESQPPRKFPLIGVLAPGFATTYTALYEAFRQALSELGYVENQTIAFEYRFADERVERLPALAAELVRLKKNRFRGSLPLNTRGSR
jgi:hypothetical protein